MYAETLSNKKETVALDGAISESRRPILKPVKTGIFNQ